ncbi:hypothetical protein QR98_0021120 [Sarcoptes scabiei]|uniref:Uncharacterized protein n=1 Tax=Sarcoptes scabiei TaxID=52283 RepID=A0A131ZXU8_SARSC|nr:hypothetical protein QR98_0021120 [Sarcoptes scabiei]
MVTKIIDLNIFQQIDSQIDDDVSDNDGFIFNAKSNDDDNEDVIERNNTPILENDLDDDEDEDGENEKEILLDEINYSNNYLIPNFYRNHRFDIKKPGPIYLDELLLEENDGQKQSPSLDLDRNIGVENRPVQHFKDSDDSKRNKKFNSFHSDQVSQTEKKDFSQQSARPVAEGPVKLDTRSQSNMLIIRTAEKNEKTNLEAIDSTHSYVIIDRMYVL